MVELSKWERQDNRGRSRSNRRKLPPHKKINKTGNILLKSVRKFKHLENWENKNPFKLVHYVELNPKEAEFRKIAYMFKKSAYKFEVDKIHRVENHYLYAGYALKCEEKKVLRGSNLKEQLLFHGTKEKNVEAICKENFDWRKCGTTGKGECWYGNGVYFSPKALVASKFSDKKKSNKVMLVALVSIGKSCSRESKGILPPEGYDTTETEDGKEIVKYEDNEFYPLYKITYHAKGGKNEKSIKNLTVQLKGKSLPSVEHSNICVMKLS